MAGSREPASVWLIAGPTASGKSALALALAEATGAQIVNADSMQLYADLRLLTARPSAADEARARHHLYGIADAEQAWSVGRWLRAALPVLDALRERGRPAVVVGGTGLYFRALTHGLADTPEVEARYRTEAQTRFDVQEEDGFRAELRAVDALAEAAIAPGDRQRLTRALEVWLATGRPLSDWRADTRPSLAPGSWRGLVVEPPRGGLFARCDARLKAMVEEGALEEVRRLLARRLSSDLPAMKALGVREFGRALAGEMTLEAALEQAQRQTRRFAKRQSTWFRNQTPDWPRWDGTTPQAPTSLMGLVDSEAR